MNEYNFNVKFEKGRISSNLKKLVQNDYNSTKINFTFDKEGRKLFKMLYPDETAYITQIDNDELIFGSGVLSQDGTYEVEIALYTEDGRLTDYATTKFEVRAELIQSDEIVEVDDRLPILDSLIGDVNKIKEDAENGVFDGEQGLPGENGYTPVRGVDYWTEEDVKEIKSYIDENGGGEVSWNDLKDKPFGEETTFNNNIIPEGTIIKNGNYYYREDGFIGFGGLGAVLTYLVNFNGTEYLCETIGTYQYENYIGNPHYLDESLESNEYPFCIWLDSYNELYIIHFDGDADTTAVISLDELKIEIKQIDTKYIPNTIATTKYVDNLIGNINTQLASLTEVE